jgi:hypothetical protein
MRGDTEMRATHCRVLAALLLGSLPIIAAADPSVGETTVLGPFTGPYAKLHPDNVAPLHIKYYGTDLGWSYLQDGKLHFLFGDTAATEKGESIQASTNALYDDGFGWVDLAEWRDPAKISPTTLPLIKLGQNPGSTEMSAINPGQAMEQFKTPIGGFTNGHDQFGMFYTSKPRGCRADSDCGAALVCDTGLGYLGEKYDNEKGQTFACIDGSPGCVADTMTAEGKPVAATGLCTDPTSSAWAKTDVGRISGVSVKNLVSLRSTTDLRDYGNAMEWMTNKFSNATPRTVRDFDPARGPGRAKQDYRNADEGASANQRVFFWGRPGFIGVGAKGRPLALYFAYADMPAGSPVKLNLHYFTGTDAKGIPQFSSSEKDATAADLDSTRAGVQADEVDIVDQVSIAWVEPLKKWVMFYGGGMIRTPSKLLPNCGVLELFTRGECKDVVIGNGAIRMRTANDPWGPWTPPQDVLVGGDPDRKPLEYQYAPGGILRHPDCTAANCAGATNWDGVDPREYGFLYAANIIEQWIKPAGNGVDIIWNVSTWDPYRVALVRTRINP